MGILHNGLFLLLIVCNLINLGLSASVMRYMATPSIKTTPPTKEELYQIQLQLGLMIAFTASIFLLIVANYVFPVEVDSFKKTIASRIEEAHNL